MMTREEVFEVVKNNLIDTLEDIDESEIAPYTTPDTFFALFPLPPDLESADEDDPEDPIVGGTS